MLEVTLPGPGLSAPRLLFCSALSLPLNSVSWIQSQSLLSFISKKPNWPKDTGAQRGRQTHSRSHSNSMGG